MKKMKNEKTKKRTLRSKVPAVKLRLQVPEPKKEH